MILKITGRNILRGKSSNEQIRYVVLHIASRRIRKARKVKMMWDVKKNIKSSIKDIR